MEFLQQNGLFFIFIGLMIFFMFRNGGCCGVGHSQSSENNHNHDQCSSTNHDKQNPQSLNMVKDPVCGMYINADKSIREIKEGQAFFFCSETCRDEFINKSSSF